MLELRGHVDGLVLFLRFGSVVVAGAVLIGAIWLSRELGLVIGIVWDEKEREDSYDKGKIDVCPFGGVLPSSFNPDSSVG